MLSTHAERLAAGQVVQDFGRQRHRVSKTVAACSQYDNLESVAREIKLKGHIAVHRDEHLKASFFGLL